MITNLRVCPREYQAVVLHAISPISMKLWQFIGSTLKLKLTNWFLFWFFPGGDRPPPCDKIVQQKYNFRSRQSLEPPLH